MSKLFVKVGTTVLEKSKRDRERERKKGSLSLLTIFFIFSSFCLFRHYIFGSDGTLSEKKKCVCTLNGVLKMAYFEWNMQPRKGISLKKHGGWF